MAQSVHILDSNFPNHSVVAFVIEVEVDPDHVVEALAGIGDVVGGDHEKGYLVRPKAEFADFVEVFDDDHLSVIIK